MLIIIVAILSILSILLVLYNLSIKLQIKSINRQLNKRLYEHTRQPIRLELIHKELNILAANINKSFKEEENLRLNVLRNEKYFKEMIANISHDLRTPLTAIKGYQQLLEKGTLTKDQKLKLNIAEKNADELGTLIENFFEYSYLVNSEPELHMEKINITNLLAQCLAESIEIFEENNLEVIFTESKPIFIYADKGMIIRILLNLIRNCTEHSVSDINVEIVITKNAVISFKNNVNEPSEIDVKRLFDRFYTADKARSKTTGLGLSIVKLLTEQNGGSTSASINESLLEIRVELPLYRESLDTANS